jgi:hypothetical protein
MPTYADNKKKLKLKEDSSGFWWVGRAGGWAQ